MSFADVLIHTCTIQRATVTKDSYGGPISTYNNHEVGVSCRLMATSERVLDNERAQHPTITDYMLMLPPGTDILDGDQVADIDLSTEESTPGIFSVEAIVSIPDGSGEHHIELGLKRIG